MASSDKKTKGKQKIKIKIIENANDRLITFSKRCTGIYKKIYEFSALCGGEILFIIFSQTGKPYSFSHPSVESVTKHFSNASQPLQETTNAPSETYRKERINFLVQDFNHDECFAVFNNLISLTRDKKIAPISSMQAPMDEDVPSPFPPRYGPNLQ
ncbi:hypothetical protein ES332_D06G146000v1 [Gossypium tomentosum]|uniref:MADS-box domain-containing protein n=1 Tax=Gossypium tomentosum TaxID=34277 RepID=A0A5D2KJE4_GOSTO|nr:hypothetical protein ES332_D06G146000v1 [Gossypium tomentosum]